MKQTIKNMDKEIIRYFRKKFKKGANPAAIIIDKVGLRVLICLASYFIYFYITKSFFLPILLAALTTLAASVAITAMENKSFDRFMAKEMRILREHIILENLLLCKKSEKDDFFIKLIESTFRTPVRRTRYGFLSEAAYYYIFDNHPSHKITAQNMLMCWREILKSGKKKCVCFSFSGFTDEAEDFLSMIEEVDFELVDSAGIVSLAGDINKIVSEETVTDTIKKRIQKEKVTFAALKREIFKSSKFKAYLITGITFGVLAFVFTFPAYLLSMSAMCITLGVMTAKTQDGD